MRVLTVANHLGSRGGLERTQMTTCRGLAARGHRVDVAYASAGDFADDWRSFAGTMVQISGSLPRRRSPVSSTAGALSAVAACARLAPEVVYVYRYWDLPMAAVVSRLSGAALVYHLCLPPPARVPPWLRSALHRVDRTLSVSRDTAARWAGTGLDPGRVEVVLTGVDLSRYVPGDRDGARAARRELGVAEEAFLVVYTGRIGRDKGVDVLVRAFDRVAAEVGGARLLVVGAPSLGDDAEDSTRYLEELVSLAGAGIRFVGGRKDVVPLLQCADVAVVPSLWAEPLSRALMEPLACGIPVVASDVGGNPEVLTGWLRDFLVPAGDPGALADRLLSVHGWRGRDPGLGDRCRAHAEEGFDLETETQAVERALQEAAAARRPARRWRRASRTELMSCG